MGNKVLKKREEINEVDKWSVNEIYSSDEKWENEFSDLKKIAPKLKEFEGKLNDGETLVNYFDVNEKISRKAESIYMYAHLKLDEDTSNTKYQAMVSKIDSYMSEFSSYSAYLVPEILSLKDGFIESEIKRVDDLKKYEFMLLNIIKEKKHILSKVEEELLASASDCLASASDIYTTMVNADLKFGTIKDEDNHEVELTEGNYGSFIRSKNREVRKSAFKKLFNKYKEFENTLAQTLSGSLKTYNFSANIRKYETPLQAALKGDNIPEEVYYNAIKTINNNLSSLHRYTKLKKKMLKLDEMHMYDLYVPVIELEKEHIEFDEAVNMTIEGLNPLGEEYLKIFKNGIDEGWIDKYINKGKKGGAYSWGGYDTKPFVLLNYNYELEDVSTLAHEMGHSIHSYYSRKTQNYYYSGYTIFCAEVASTTNEALLIHYLINKETDKKRKLFLINQELEQIRTTVFRQIMFAEFELFTHESFKSGNPLTAEDYSEKWHELNKKYFGDDMIVDSEIDIEWSRIPHFYNDFYVYQYATGYAAASAFAKAILNKEKDAVSKYIDFLKSGGSDYPIELLKKGGVDMTTSKPLEATIERFNELLDMLEKDI